MKSIFRTLFLSIIGILFWVFVQGSSVISFEPLRDYSSDMLLPALPLDTPDNSDTITYPLQQDGNSPYETAGKSPLYLNDPSNITTTVVYDPVTGKYVFQQMLGDVPIGTPYSMTLEEYMEYDRKKSSSDYFRSRAQQDGLGASSSVIPKLHIGSKAFSTIFGSNTIDIRPQGSAELIFGVNSSKREDPSLNVKQQRVTNFDFQEKIQMNVRAKVGDKIDFGINYNTEANFEFDNKMKLAYEGDEDEILQLIEAGDVSMPLNTSLIQGSQSLFGIKTKWKFGKTTITTVFSQQRSESKNITVEGGAQLQEFYVKADEYEENKHFFLSHYFREHYNEALENLPAINSGVNITKVEVWVTTIGAPVNENRNIVAYMDLGEYDPYRSDVIFPSIGNPTGMPFNDANDLYSGLMSNSNSVRDINTVSGYLSGAPYTMVAGRDFEKVENARRLTSREYTINSKLGFISINSRLNSDQVLAVAYQYTIVGDTTVRQVGEFSDQGIVAPQNLMVKLLKSTNVNTKIPTWDLMMKNVYSLQAYQLSAEDFRLNVVYENPEFGVPTGFITEGAISGQPLIQAMGLDKLNTQLDPISDGVFDYIDGAATNGGTVESRNGRIFFPVLEPFGEDLRKAIDPNNPNSQLASKYAYDSLYTLTKHLARQYPDKNRFAMEGRYKSGAGSEISLMAMNVPQGSVKVTAGGVPLRENVDYTVDYTLGRVKIINEGILNSGTPINISLESNSMFNIQSKTLLGAHIDYEVNKDFMLGATIMNLTERPLTQKVNTGDEPISNTIWGLDGSYQKESRWLTKMIDKIPFIDTKAPSMVSITGEFAHMIPGHPRALGNTGVSYIDDFEGSSSGIDLMNVGRWKLASTPQGQYSTDMFPEAGLKNTLEIGYNRAQLSWYVIDPLFVRNNNLTPEYIKNDKDAQSNHYVREVFEKEVFPNKEQTGNVPTNLPVFNLAYYPNERGPYNFDVEGGGISKGINPDGSLLSPESRWAGVMRQIESTDFTATNVEYIEFWLMDPFVDPDGSGPEQGMQNGGDLYFNLGDISEDILRDGRKAFENGLPTSDVRTNVDTTIWGLVPTLQALTNSFDNNPDAREYQDVGYDGLRTVDERSFYQVKYLDRIGTLYGTGSQAYIDADKDPSSDDYHYFRGSDYDADLLSILERYKKYNGVDGNSPTAQQSPEIYPTTSTTVPDVEDINQDNTLSEEERYFQYRVQLNPAKMVQGENYISDIYEANVKLKNGTTANVKWYQFRIPVSEPDKVIGQIQDFTSIRFMRMFMKNFSEKAVLRFATLELIRNEWRKYGDELLSPGDYLPGNGNGATSFDVTRVNIEENGKRSPIPYVLPPGIERELAYNPARTSQMNEQSVVLKVCNLQDGDARAAYKTTDFDFRRYKKLNMFIHAEEAYANKPLQDGDLHFFIRLGTDFTENYYEYEIPLKLTPWYTTDENDIWPSENEINLELQKLLNAKQARNIAIRENPNGNISINTPFIAIDGQNKITIVGTPTLSAVKTIMIGIRNPKAIPGSAMDDGLDKCAEIWVNELRVTDFDESGGWAANTVIAADLADLGNVVLAGNISTAGFGSIEQKVNERQQENIYGYDFATNLELGKFFPEKSGIRIPMHFDVSETFKDPEFNPVNPDIKYEDDLATFKTKAERDSVRLISTDYTKRTSFNLMNVKKMRTGTSGKPHIYDVENFDFTYQYSQQYRSNIDIEYDDKRQYKGAIGYTFTKKPKNYKPFSKSKFLRKYKSLRLIRDFNFNLLPKQIGFRTNVDRLYNESLMRKKTRSLIIINPTYVKTFSWTRNYDLRYDFSRSLKFDYKANVQARIDEPAGLVDKNSSGWHEYRDTVWQNIADFGRTTNFNQSYNVNYAVPINKIPILSWINLTTRYGGMYRWTAAPLSTQFLGNTIENSNKIQVNVTGNLTRLYNKIDYLKKINQKGSSRGMASRNSFKMNIPTAEQDSIKKANKNWGKIILDASLRVMMMVRSANFSYTESNGTLLPGFNQNPGALGASWNNQYAPGWDFIFGKQINIAERAAQNGWITESQKLNNPTIRKHTSNINGRISIEPIPSMKIELTFLRNYSEIAQEYWRYDTLSQNYASYTPTVSGSFSMSYNTWRTSFVKDDEKTYTNATFENFKQFLLPIAERLANSGTRKWDGTYQLDTLNGILYPDGYSRTNREVMMYSFLAAYSGKDPNSIGLVAFPKIPLPNWRFSYNGLTKIEFIAQWFKSINITHAYTSTYTVGSFTNNVLYKIGDDGVAWVRDQLGNNYIPEYDMTMVSVNEQYSPLINFDMTLENSLILKVAVRKSRNIAMSFSNNQITEIKSDELIIGTGYRFKEVPLKLKLGGGSKTFKSDINLKLDFSIRKNKTILRKLIEDIDQISQGQSIMSINFSGDYQFSRSLTFKVFYDQVINNPFVSSQYPNSNIKAGISLRFTLSQ